MITIKKTALIYCENQFGLMDGKTAAGLIRHSETYLIVGVIDSSLAGKDAGEELGDNKNNIPIFENLREALANLPNVPHCYIYGKAPLDARISAEERLLILEAMAKGMDIVNGLHEFFSDDREFIDRAIQCGIQIKDLRKPPKLKDLHVFTGKISQVNVPVIAVLGTDCACGKMTTAVELNKTLNSLGVKSVLVATGQTCLMQGARYGVSIDALVSQFVIGEIENAVIQAFECENPDLILVEGQGAVGHPAFMSSVGILNLLFKYFHSGHHYSTQPTPWTSFALDPPEALIQGLFFLIVVFIIPLHFMVLVSLLLLMTFWAVLNHLGLELFDSSLSRHWLVKWLIGSTYHSIHHRKYSMHYGLYFTFWDRLLNTYNSNYESKFDSFLK